MRQEVKVATQFWAEQVAQAGARAEVVERFRDALEEELKVAFTGHWYPNDPRRGSGYRSISLTSQRADPVLTRAAASCGLANVHRLLLPHANGVYMYVNPGAVAVRTFAGHIPSLTRVLWSEAAAAPPQPARTPLKQPAQETRDDDADDAFFLKSPYDKKKAGDTEPQMRLARAVSPPVSVLS